MFILFKRHIRGSASLGESKLRLTSKSSSSHEGGAAFPRSANSPPSKHVIHRNSSNLRAFEPTAAAPASGQFSQSDGFWKNHLHLAKVGQIHRAVVTIPVQIIAVVPHHPFPTKVTDSYERRTFIFLFRGPSTGTKERPKKPVRTATGPTPKRHQRSRPLLTEKRMRPAMNGAKERNTNLVLQSDLVISQFEVTKRAWKRSLSGSPKRSL